MDLLDLSEVAELLGEPEAAILAACERFPESVPTVGNGSDRRFPSVALDVLRLITDAMAAGAPPEATIHLLATHFPPDTDPVAQPEVSETSSESSSPRSSSPERPLDEIVAAVLGDQETLIRETVERETAAVRRHIDLAFLALRDEIKDVRSGLALTARAADLDAFRTESRATTASASASASASRETISSADVSAAVAPLGDAIGTLLRGIDGLRAELSSLRAEIVEQTQGAELATAVAELRTDIQGITAHAQRPIDQLRPVVVAAAAVDTSVANVPKTNIQDGQGIDGNDAVNGTMTHGADDSEASGIITRLATRAPRRMGRSFAADEV